MSERENGDFISCKKFKSSHENEIRSGGHKGFAEGEAGNYFLGPVIKEYVMAPVKQCLARKKGTDEYYLMKILVLDDSDSADKSSFVRRTIFHNEYSFLSLLKNHPGVIQLCDFFKVCGIVLLHFPRLTEWPSITNTRFPCSHVLVVDSLQNDYVEHPDKSRKTRLKRICMVLECLIPHGHHNSELIPLNHYLKEGRLTETEALYTFYNLLLVLEDLHNKNIVHRDLKFSNIILNRKSLKVKLMDFYYAELLTSCSKNKSAQCRTWPDSPPDALEGEAVLLKVCDMYSAGVILYGMLNGSIMKNDYSISNNPCISDGTKELLKKIQFRLEASEAVDMVSTLLAVQFTSQNPSLFLESKSSDQVVPECPDFESKEQQQESTPTAKKKPFAVAPGIPTEPESDAKMSKQKGEKMARVRDETSQRSSPTPANPKSSQQNNSLISRKEIKYAMLRLGVTSVNSINALSFNYSKKNLCR